MYKYLVWKNRKDLMLDLVGKYKNGLVKDSRGSLMFVCFFCGGLLG